MEDQPFSPSNLYSTVLTEFNGLLNCFSRPYVFTPETKLTQAASFVIAHEDSGLILIEVTSKGQDTVHEDSLYSNTVQCLEGDLFGMFHDVIILVDGSLLAGIF
jgi:hypothetical protein